MVMIYATVPPPIIHDYSYSQYIEVDLERPLPLDKGYLPLFNKKCKCYKGEDYKFNYKMK